MARRFRCCGRRLLRLRCFLLLGLLCFGRFLLLGELGFGRLLPLGPLLGLQPLKRLEALVGFLAGAQGSGLRRGPTLLLLLPAQSLGLPLPELHLLLAELRFLDASRGGGPLRVLVAPALLGRGLLGLGPLPVLDLTAPCFLLPCELGLLLTFSRGGPLLGLRALALQLLGLAPSCVLLTLVLLLLLTLRGGGPLLGLLALALLGSSLLRLLAGAVFFLALARLLLALLRSRLAGRPSRQRDRLRGGVLGRERRCG